MSFLPVHTRAAWPAVVESFPAGAYLAGGTAIALRLGHRVSEDLDIFLEQRVRFDDLERSLRSRGAVEVLTLDDEPGAEQTLNVLFVPEGSVQPTKVQYLGATYARLVDPLTVIDGMPVAGLRDLCAMKLRAITGRAELRDYVDLMTLEEKGHVRVEEGLSAFLVRFQPPAARDALATVLRALASLDDVANDSTLRLVPPVRGLRTRVQRYWARRVPEIVSNSSVVALTEGGPAIRPRRQGGGYSGVQ